MAITVYHVHIHFSNMAVISYYRRRS